MFALRFHLPPAALALGTALLAVSSPPGHAAPVWKDVTPAYVTEQGFNVAMNGVDFGNGVFVALGNKTGADITSTNRAVIFTSPDGSRWTQRTIDFGDKNIAPGSGRVRFIKDQFYFSTQDNPGSVLYSSKDGATWAKSADLGVGANGFFDFATGNGTYVLARPDGSIFSPLPTSSTDLVHWTSHGLPDESGASNFNSIGFGAGRFVIVGAKLSPPYVFTSTDGASWTAGDGLDKFGGYRWLAAGNGLFLVDGKISADGLTWTDVSPGLPPASVSGVPIPRTPDFARFVNGQFVCTSNFASANIVFTSQDGQNWTEAGQLENAGYSAQDITYGNGHYVALTQTGLYVSGDDGGTTNPPAGKLAELSGSVAKAKAKLNKKGKLVFSGSLSLTNTGPKAAKGVDVAVYLAGDDAPGVARFLGMVSLADAGKMKLGKNAALPFKLKADAEEVGSVTGKHLMFVIDPQDTVKESDETNNTLSSEPLP